METSDKAELEWSVAGRALPGESLSGDGHLVARTSIGWLLAVADGLGHGPEAATAARAFVEVLTHHADDAPAELIRLGHESLKSTRGCVAAVAAIDRNRNLLSWLGVGNVEGVIFHTGNPAGEYITTRGGIVGYRLPELQLSFLQLSDGDTLFLATDGIESGFTQSIPLRQPPELLAAYVLDRYAKPVDDALVLVARWHFYAGPQGGILL